MCGGTPKERLPNRNFEVDVLALRERRSNQRMSRSSMVYVFSISRVEFETKEANFPTSVS